LDLYRNEKIETLNGLKLFSLRDTARGLRSQRPLHVQGDVGHPVNKVVDPKRTIGKKWRAEEEERHKGLLTP
jgi:hypothetical protein